MCWSARAAGPWRPWPLLAVVLLCLAVCRGFGAAPEAGTDKLRRLARLPTFNVGWNFFLSSSRGYVLGSDELLYPDEIAALEKQLKQTPDDAEALYRLGLLYSWTDEPDKARQAIGRAVVRLRKRLEAQPANGRLHTRLALALWEQSEGAEAEAEFRRGTQLAPEDWRTWLGLGQFLDTESLQVLFRNAEGGGGTPEYLQQLTTATTFRPLPAERIEKARSLLREAGPCLDQAVKLGPREPEPRVIRACSRGSKRLIDAMADPKLDQEQAATVLATFMFTGEAVPDLREAARLRPRDYRLVGCAVVFEAMSLAAAGGKLGMEGMVEDSWWRQLPETNKTSILAGVSWLEDLSQDADPKVAAGALEMLAAIRFLVFRDQQACSAAARRAVALDASREQAWELYVGGLALGNRDEELLKACQERLKARISPRNHLLVAKAHEALDQLEAAEQHVDAALKLAPQDFQANLSKAVLRLRRGPDFSDLVRAAMHLDRAEKALGPRPPRHFVLEYLVDRSLHLALSGETANARQVLKKVLELDPENEDAREIQQALPP